MSLKTTDDLRKAMIQLYEDIEAGRVTNAQARTRAYVAKTIIDTLKVEITATALGKQITTLDLDSKNRSIALQATVQ